MSYDEQRISDQIDGGLHQQRQQEMTQQTMTKEIDEILDKYYHGEYDLIEVKKFFMEAHEQELKKEKECNRKLYHALKLAITIIPDLQAEYHPFTIFTIKQSLTEYEKL